MTIPQFKAKKDANDVTTQVRLQQISNGYVVKTGKLPVYYEGLEEAAEAVKQGLLKAAWPSLDEE